MSWVLVPNKRSVNSLSSQRDKKEKFFRFVFLLSLFCLDCFYNLVKMDTVLSWDEHKVNKWISSIGYSCFELQFKGMLKNKVPGGHGVKILTLYHLTLSSSEQGITGDVLVNLDHDTLKDLAVHSVGQRMDILKHIYHLKIAQRLPINEWDYIPPSKSLLSPFPTFLT